MSMINHGSLVLLILMLLLARLSLAAYTMC